MGCMIYGQGRGGGGEPPSARVQLAGQTLGHIFSVAPPQHKYGSISHLCKTSSGCTEVV